MPFGDGTGPWWAQERGYMQRRRFGRCFRRGMDRYAPTGEDESAEMKTYAEELKAELTIVEKRLEELKER